MGYGWDIVGGDRQIREIKLQKEYDLEYRQLLWEAVVEDYLRSPYGRKPYLEREVGPVLKKFATTFIVEGDPEFKFQLPEFDDDYKPISDYMRYGGAPSETDRKPRVFDVLFIRMFDAYMKAKHPVIASTFAPHRDTDATGLVFGEFLSDVVIQKKLYEFEAKLQSLIGIYEYVERDTAGKGLSNPRYFALFRGDTKGYLLVMDFHWNTDKKIVPLHDEHLTLYYGFCIPGHDFSPVIMRSLNQRERQTGMMFGKDALIDFSADTLDQIYLQTFTTDIDHSPDMTEKDPSELLFGEVMRLKNGPMLNRTMFKVTDQPTYQAIVKRIEKIKRDRL